MFSVYILVMVVAYKIYALNYMFKCHQFMKVIKQTYKEVEKNE